MLPINKYVWLIFYYDFFIKSTCQHTVVGIPAAILMDSS